MLHPDTQREGVAYANIGEIEKAREVILGNYRRHPDYLFARLNYADICLADGNYRKVAEILDYKFDLKQAYPRRSRFHLSEFISYMSVVRRYFAGIGENELAENVCEMMRDIAPDHPSTRQLYRQLYPSLLRRLIRRFRPSKL